MNYPNTAKLLRASRKKVKLSQWDVSLILNLKSSQFISNIERGIASLPIDHWHCIAKLYKIKVNDIKRAYFKDIEGRIRTRSKNK